MHKSQPRTDKCDFVVIVPFFYKLLPNYKKQPKKTQLEHKVFLDFFCLFPTPIFHKIVYEAQTRKNYNWRSDYVCMWFYNIINCQALFIAGTSWACGGMYIILKETLKYLKSRNWKSKHVQRKNYVKDN